MTKKEFRNKVKEALVDILENTSIRIDGYSKQELRVYKLLCEKPGRVEEIRREYQKHYANIIYARVHECLGELLRENLIKLVNGKWKKVDHQWETRDLTTPTGFYTIVGSPLGFAAWNKVAKL